ncbi:MAG TPA: Snf7 family protein [Candidatus Lokiarchaeia archaeon]|nr:Snf7 family protein [Candidatus Lokiarchaeia archaeon]
MSGNKGGKDTTLSVLTKLKIFNKRLSRQATQLNMKSQRARAKAIDLRKKGDTAGSKMQMRAHLQMQAWKNNIENFQLKLDGLQYKLEQAKAVNDVESILKNVAGVITVLQKTVSAPEISQIISQIDLGISDFDATQEVAAEGMEDMGATDQISDDQVDLALDEVDAEIMAETGTQLPSAGSGKISDLEKEIQKLKQQDQ